MINTKMKTIFKLNGRIYSFDEENNDVKILDGDKLVLFLIQDYNKLNERLDHILSLYETQMKSLKTLIEVVKLNNEAVKKMREEIIK